MQEKFADYQEAAKEIDGLSSEGFFGESSKALTLSSMQLGMSIELLVYKQFAMYAYPIHLQLIM